MVTGIVDTVPSRNDNLHIIASSGRIFVSQVFSVHPREDWNALASEYAPLSNFQITYNNEL